MSASRYIFFVALFSSACADDGDPCIAGQQGCECTQGTCNSGLYCVDGSCQTMTNEEESSTGTSTESGSDDLHDTTETESESVDGTTEDGCLGGTMNCLGECVDIMNDDANCGGCGNSCVTLDGYGHCSGGVCGPTLSECFPQDQPVECEIACSQQTWECAMDACDGATTFFYSTGAACEDFAEISASDGPCSEPSTPDNGYYRCCCAQ